MCRHVMLIRVPCIDKKVPFPSDSVSLHLADLAGQLGFSILAGRADFIRELIEEFRDRIPLGNHFFHLFHALRNRVEVPVKSLPDQTAERVNAADIIVFYAGKMIRVLIAPVLKSLDHIPARFRGYDPVPNDENDLIQMFLGYGENFFARNITFEC